MVQQTMDSMAMVEELAWLIKDNLPSKHLVLSAEEMFVEFLDPEQRSSGEDILMLEPMISYHRMLLHRLADIFGLVHGSVGEGDDRRLVVERCEDSSIPGVLVSDILECSNHGKESVCSQSALQLLKRNTDPSGDQRYNLVQTPQISFEERQAAYLAARERIFSEDWGQSHSEPVISRPRAVPLVARRMIAHALGKRISADQYSNVGSTSGPDIEKEATVVAAGPDGLVSGVQQVKLHEPSSKGSDYSPAKAAKRMFAQALGLHFSTSPCRISHGQMDTKTSSSTCLRPSEVQQQGQGLRRENVNTGCNSTSADVSKGSHRISSGKVPSGSLVKQPSQPTVSKHEHEQGKAAQRMLAQALGLRSSSVGLEKRGKTFDGGTFS